MFDGTGGIFYTLQTKCHHAELVELTFIKLESDKSYVVLGVFVNTTAASSLDLRPSAVANYSLP